MSAGQAGPPAPGTSVAPPSVFWLFVAGAGRHSLQARENLAKLCEAHLPEGCEIRIVDVLEDFTLARDHGVVVTPTLLRVSPPPRVIIIGTLSDTPTVLAALQRTGGER